MDSLIGFTGKGWTMVAADCSAARSILVFKHDEDKILELDTTMVVALAGEQGDRSQLGDYILRNIKLNKLRTGISQSCDAIANFIRRQMANFLRKSPYQVNMLIGGIDPHDGSPNLYWMDYMGCLQKVNYAGQGYCSNFVLSIMDCHWKENMTLEEGKDLLRKCLAELSIRFLINQKKFLIKLVTKDGIEIIEL